MQPIPLKLSIGLHLCYPLESHILIQHPQKHAGPNPNFLATIMGLCKSSHPKSLGSRRGAKVAGTSIERSPASRPKLPRDQGSAQRQAVWYWDNFQPLRPHPHSTQHRAVGLGSSMTSPLGLRSFTHLISLLGYYGACRNMKKCHPAIQQGWVLKHRTNFKKEHEEVLK